MNGVKAIFVRELRAGFLPDAVILLLALATFAVVERAMVVGGELSEEARQGIDLALFGSAAVLSFASGARTFPRELKVRRLLSLYTFPISRGALWCALVGGRFTGTAAALVGLLLIRPSILSTLADPAVGAMAPLLTLVPVLFAAGLCFALTFEHTVLVYLIGYPVTIYSVVQALGLANAGAPSWRPSGFVVWLWTPALASIFLVFLALSWWFFQLGDFTVRRRSLARQALLAIFLLGSLGLTGAVTHRLLLADRSGQWMHRPVLSAPWLSYQERSASPGGRYLVIAERPMGRSDIARLSVVETATGRVITTQIWHDLRWASWSGKEQVLHLLALDHWAPEPWRTLLAPQPAWIRLSPEGKELSRFRLGNIRAVAFLPDGTDLITHDIHSKIQLLCLQSQPTPLVLGEIPWSKEWQPISPLSYCRKGTVFGAIGSMWRVENRGPRKLSSSESQGFGPPAQIGLRWPKDVTTISLWTRSLNSLNWVQRARDLTPIAPVVRDFRSLAPVHVRKGQRPSISFPEGLAAYLPEGGGGDGLASLYDGALDREIPLPACVGGRAVSPELIAAQSGPAFLVRFQCRVPASLREKIRFRHFYYLPGSGTVKPLPALDRMMTEEKISLAYLAETSAIWRSEGRETWMTLRDGKLRTLWPSRR